MRKYEADFLYVIVRFLDREYDSLFKKFVTAAQKTRARYLEDLCLEMFQDFFSEKEHQRHYHRLKSIHQARLCLVELFPLYKRGAYKEDRDSVEELYASDPILKIMDQAYNSITREKDMRGRPPKDGKKSST